MNKIITFLVCFAFFFALFNPIRAFIQGGEAVAMFIPMVVIYFADMMYLRPHTYFFLIIALIIAFLGITGNLYFDKWIPEITVLGFGYFGLEHYLLTRDDFYARWVLRCTYITLLLLLAISLPQFIAMPNLARLMTVAAKDPSIEFDYIWTISYKNVHMIPCASVPLFVSYSLATSKKEKLIYAISIGLMCGVMLFADATTPLILLAAIITYYCIYKFKTNTPFFYVLKIFLVSLVIAVLLSATLLTSFLTLVQPIFKGTTTYHKINEISLFAEEGTTSGDMNSRSDLYMMSIDAIVENPFEPENDINKIGKHSFIFDHMAAMGLILFLPYAIFLYKCYKNPLFYISENKINYIIAYLAFLLLALFKNFFLFTVGYFLVPMYFIRLESLTEECDENDTENFYQESQELP